VAVLKVLFLDIDGVVLSGQDLWNTGNNRYLPPEKIALIAEVCEKAGAVIVVSSTWRFSDDTFGALQSLGLPLHPDWRTAMPKMQGLIWIAEGRGHEIADWLARHPETSAYAIVDDDSDMLPAQAAHFVQTPFEVGIQQSHADALVAILSEPTRAAA
jgi:hypothetical protein